MPEENSVVKQYLGGLKKTIESLLFDGLDQANRERFFASKSRDYLKQDYYEELPIDNELIKSLKVTLNILTSLEKLIDSPTNTAALSQLITDLNKPDFNKFSTIIKSAFKKIQDKTPAVFNIISSNIENKLNENPENAKLVKELTTEAYQEARKAAVDFGGADSDIVDSLKNMIVTFQQMAQPNPVNKPLSVNVEKNIEEIDPVFRALHDKVLEVVAKSYGLESIRTFVKNEKGRYPIFEGENAAIRSVKGILNALQGLANIQHTLQNDTQTNLISVLAKIIRNLKTVYTGYDNLISQQNTMALASAINEIIGNTLKDFNAIMADLASYADKSEIDLGLRQGLILDQLQSVFAAHQKLMETAKADLKPDQGYPYFTARIKMLEAESEAKQEAIKKAKYDVTKLEAMKKFFEEHGNQPLSQYSRAQLIVIRNNIDLLGLSKKDKSQYLTELNTQIAQGKNDSYLGQVDSMVKSAANYAGLTLHSFVVDQAGPQLEKAKGKQALLEEQIENIDKKINILRAQSFQTKATEKIANAPLEAAPVSDLSPVKDKPGIIKNFFSAITAFFTKVADKLLKQFDSVSEDEPFIYGGTMSNINFHLSKKGAAPAAGGKKDKNEQTFNDEDIEQNSTQPISQKTEAAESLNEPKAQSENKQEIESAKPSVPTFRKH